MENERELSKYPSEQTDDGYSEQKLATQIDKGYSSRQTRTQKTVNIFAKQKKSQTIFQAPKEEEI